MVRNRAKRRLREAIRFAGLPAGYDFVIIAGKGVAVVPFPTLVSWLGEAVAWWQQPGAMDRGRV